jgi:hypothetical protein
MKARTNSIERSWPIFLVSLTWLMMTAYPPWQAIEYSQTFSADVIHSLPGRVIDGYCQYAPIFARPDPRFKGFYEVHIDFFRLFNQYLIAAVCLPILLKVSKLDFANRSEPETRMASAAFKGLSVICIVTCFSLLAPDIKARTDGQNPGTNQVVRKSVIYSIEEIPAGTVIAPQMIELHMLNETLIPAGALQRSGEALGSRAKHNISAGVLLNKDDIEAKK